MKSEINYKGQKFFILYFLNFVFGVVTVATINAWKQFIFEGLYHKILNVIGISIPIEAIATALVSCSFAFYAYLVIVLDYGVYKNGIDNIKIKGEKTYKIEV